MNAEALLEIAVKAPDFLSVSGSRLYGTDVEGSDFDYRGFVIPPIAYLLGTKVFKSRELPGDHKIYSMKKYIELILEGDPQCTELLFVPEHLIERQTRFGKSIMDLGRKYALSNKIFARIMGYSNDEWRKAMAIKIVPEKRKKQEPEILNDFWNCYDWLTREEKELIISTFNKNRPHKVVSSVAGLGAKRKALVEKYGYCTKSAAHSIRLVRQVTELMLTGKIIFPRPDAELLKSIRNGELTKEEITRIYEESRANAEATREKSILNDSPNADKIWSQYLSIVVYQCSC